MHTGEGTRREDLHPTTRPASDDKTCIQGQDLSPTGQDLHSGQDLHPGTRLASRDKVWASFRRRLWPGSRDPDPGIPGPRTRVPGPGCRVPGPGPGPSPAIIS